MNKKQNKKTDDEKILGVMQIVVFESGKISIGFDPRYRKEPDAWTDLGIAMEGVGILTKICMNEGITEHKGKSLEDYLTGYIKDTIKSCRVAFAIKKGKTK